MSAHPNIIIEPELIKKKTREADIKKLIYQTGKHDHEKLLKTLKNDN